MLSEPCKHPSSTCFKLRSRLQNIAIQRKFSDQHMVFHRIGSCGRSTRRGQRCLLILSHAKW